MSKRRNDDYKISTPSATRNIRRRMLSESSDSDSSCSSVSDNEENDEKGRVFKVSNQDLLDLGYNKCLLDKKCIDDKTTLSHEQLTELLEANDILMLTPIGSEGKSYCHDRDDLKYMKSHYVNRNNQDVNYIHPMTNARLSDNEIKVIEKFLKKRDYTRQDEQRHKRAVKNRLGEENLDTELKIFIKNTRFIKNNAKKEIDRYFDHLEKYANFLIENHNEFYNKQSISYLMNYLHPDSSPIKDIEDSNGNLVLNIDTYENIFNLIDMLAVFKGAKPNEQDGLYDIELGDEPNFN